MLLTAVLCGALPVAARKARAVTTMADGDYLEEAAAEKGGQTRLAAAMLTLGGGEKTARPAKSRTVK